MSKLDEIKPGDRVRITVEGIVESRDYDGDLWINEADKLDARISRHLQSLPTFQIERIEQPLVVGDVVISKEDGDRGVIRAIYENEVWVFWEKDRLHTTTHLSEVERAK